MQWRTLIHLRLWGRPLWRLLAVVALLFLAAACFLGWSIAVLNCVHLIDYGLAVALAGAIGATCLLWGGAQALISRAAYELGVDVRAAPARRWALAQGYRGRWVLSSLGTLVFILVLKVWWLWFLP